MFEKVFLYLSYASQLSRWIRELPTVIFNDFYNSKFDYNKRYDLYDYVFNSENLKLPMSYLEFGVYQGDSMKWWVNRNSNPDSRFCGFDTFAGLPEGWGQFNKGDMSTSGQVPFINDQRCHFIRGLFQKTLDPFLAQTTLLNKKVIHLDADLYSSTLFVLTRLSNHLRKDDVVIFDEFNIPLDEFRAFLDFTRSYQRELKLIAAVNNYFAVAFKVI